MAQPTVLMADDQPDVIAALRLLLRTAGFEAQGGTQPHLPLIAMTGWANLETAVDAMRRGVRGYIPKPWNNEALLQVLRAEIGQARADHGQWREAQAIHRALLPAVLPDIAGCRLAWRCEPASGFGGDYYDAFVIGPNRLAVCIADVCGKGLPAALLVSSLQATIRAFVTDDAAPHEAVIRINRARERPAGAGVCRRSRLGRSAARRRRHGAGPGLHLRTCGHGQRRPTSEQCPERRQQVK